MFSPRVFVRNALRDVAQLARQSIVGNTRPACLSRPLAASVCQTNSATSARSYATDAAEGAQAVKKEGRGRPRGATIANGASPKTKKATTTTSSAKKPKKPTKPAAPKKQKKVVESTQEKMVKKVKELKQIALLDQPKGLPMSSWLVYFAQNHVPQSEVKNLASKFKDLPQSEIDHLTNIAKANSTANKEAFKTWVESHTVEEIYKANVARRALRRISDQPIAEGRKQHYIDRSMGYRAIRDIRVPKKVDSPYITYVRERFLSGEFAGVAGPEAIKTISTAWKQFSAEEKQAYKDKAPRDIGKLTADV